jgi:hypothetical protein
MKLTAAEFWKWVKPYRPFPANLLLHNIHYTDTWPFPPAVQFVGSNIKTTSSLQLQTERTVILLTSNILHTAVCTEFTSWVCLPLLHIQVGEWQISLQNRETLLPDLKCNNTSRTQKCTAPVQYCAMNQITFSTTCSFGDHRLVCISSYSTLLMHIIRGMRFEEKTECYGQ